MEYSLDISNNSVLVHLEESLLEDLKTSYEKDKIINDDLLESLFFIYKNPFLEVLNLIDKHDQQVINSDDKTSPEPLAAIIKCEKRFIYQVKGSINYYLFDGVNFCTCSSFKYNVLHKSDYLYCKHLVMVKILTAMNRIPTKEVKQPELSQLIKQIQ
ncbi:zinc finger SWIM domain-containing 7 [Brachionus plicatilis]|uniref:Zinc finger SWIM domain-containing 7 n=1 Tax=Brachionus plicatilis TaxID=10195 RepID=A0A3M7PAG4_BRAPC|nr:zinc finger SWIM domain-containing 7 [Brachionus plicatilis]